jgi:hypothetical protein
MSPAKRQDIISFKVDDSLREAMRGIPNRSEFIRAAILAALDSACPLCLGTGILTPDQRRHWREFSGKHALSECEECHAVHITCLEEGHDHALSGEVHP